MGSLEASRDAALQYEVLRICSSWNLFLGECKNEKWPQIMFCPKHSLHKAPVLLYPAWCALTKLWALLLLFLGGKQAGAGFLQPLQNQSEEGIYTSTSKSHPKDMHFRVMEEEGKPLPDVLADHFCLKASLGRSTGPCTPRQVQALLGKHISGGWRREGTAVLRAACSTATMLLRTFLLSLLCCRVLKCNLREMTAAA